MNIYVQVEIRVRELEGRLLLALAAAERGHRVVVGDVWTSILFRPEALPPGLLHDKDLVPSTKRVDLYERLVAAGWTITSQDEEHWLNFASFDVPARKRFGAATLRLAASSFAWGPHEADALAAHYPDLAPTRVLTTGSPRTDLWRPELRDYHRALPAGVELAGRDVVLVVSNFNHALDVNPFWVRMRDKRNLFDGPEDPFEFDRYGLTAQKYLLLGEFVRAVRRLSTAHPDAVIVVRPHPIEPPSAWHDLLGPLPNVLVSSEGTLIAWIQRARAVVQNGGTTAYETAVADVPLISFVPAHVPTDGILADSPSNLLGRVAHDQDELAALVAEALGSTGRSEPSAWRSPAADDLLRRRLAPTTGTLAADRIVDAWEAAPAPAAAGQWRAAGVRTLRAHAHLRHRAATAVRAATAGVPRPGRGRGRPTDRPAPFAIAHKFPPLAQPDVDAIVGGLRRTLGRFTDVRARVIAPDLVAVEPTGRSGR